MTVRVLTLVLQSATVTLMGAAYVATGGTLWLVAMSCMFLALCLNLVLVLGYIWDRDSADSDSAESTV